MENPTATPAPRPAVNIPKSAQVAARKLKRAWKAHFEANTAYRLGHTAFDNLLRKNDKANTHTEESRKALETAQMEHVRNPSAYCDTKSTYEEALRAYESALWAAEV